MRRELIIDVLGDKDRYKKGSIITVRCVDYYHGSVSVEINEDKYEQKRFSLTIEVLEFCSKEIK